MSIETLLLAEQSKTCPTFNNTLSFSLIMVLQSFWRSKKMPMRKVFAYSTPNCPFPRFLKVRTPHRIKPSQNSLRVHLYRPFQILDLPNIGDHYYLTTFNDLLAYGKKESEVYFTIFLTNRTRTATQPKPSIRVIFKWFI